MPEANGLMLRNMNLKSIPACFAALCDLADRIDISKNDFSEFPIVLLEFKQLKKLNLSDNKLTKLPDSFINFKLLEELDLSANFFVKMPEILSEIKFLKSLKVKCANPLFFKGSFPEKIEKRTCTQSFAAFKYGGKMVLKSCCLYNDQIWYEHVCLGHGRRV
jgi:hypothetical protein